MPTPSLPYAIRSLHIEKFRHLCGLKLDFTGVGDEASDVIVLAGDNGVGKTSVLEACWYLLSDVEIHEEILVHGEIQTPEGVKQLSRRSGRAGNRSGFPIYYLPAGLWWLPLLDHFRWRMLDKTLVRWGEGLLDQRGEDRHVVMERLNGAWKLLLPFSKSHVEFERRGELILNCFDFVREGTQRVTFVELSLGEQTLFTYLLTLLAMESKSGGVLILDEPETHLDATRRRGIVKALRSFAPKVQFLFATHSTEVLDAVYSYQRHFLLAENDPRRRGEPEDLPAEAFV
jgi:predicted ATPase